MTTRPAAADLGHLVRVLCAQDDQGRSDGQHLKRFLVDQDEAAFAAIVRRHGPMVLGVCRRILGNAADSEDAFQAAFLILVRKAAALTSRSTIGDWLHGVARHTALKARAAARQRRTKEQKMARPLAAAEETRNDWASLVDEGVTRLPEKYRSVIVLCDMEGKTRREAAAELGWPEGTVAGRLARARALLARYFARRGLVLPGGALAVTLAPGAASACAPFLLVSTVKAAALVAAGKATAAGSISGPALALTNEVLKAMFWNQMKKVTLVLLLVVLAAIGGGFTFGVLAGGAQPGQPQGGEEAAAEKKQAEAPQIPPANEQWGKTTQGLQMVLSVRGKDKDGRPQLAVAIRNVGDQDVTLNLGMMLANGKPLNGGHALFPSNIRLKLTDAQGKTRDLDLSMPGIAGRVDDYLVMLRVGSVYSLQLPWRDFSSPNTKELAFQLKPGKQQISAEFVGCKAKHGSGQFIMNFWEGTLTSNILELEPLNSAGAKVLSRPAPG